MRFILALLAVPLILTDPKLSFADLTAPTTAPAVSMSISPAGDLSIMLGGKQIGGGHWQIVHFPFQNVVADETPVGAIASTKVTNDSPQHAVVTDLYSAATVTTDISLDGEDIRLSSHIENKDKTKSLERLNFVGIDFRFARPAGGTLASFHWTYLAAQGVSLFHPSVAESVGGVYAFDDQFGFAVYSNSEFENKSLFNAEFEKDGIIPANCRLQFLTTREVAAGQAIDVDVSFRIAADTSIPSLLGGYKKDYDKHFPVLLYHPDNRPLAAFTGVTNAVTRSNPYGFNGAVRRLDSAAGTNAYVRLIAPPLQAGNALGIIFWSPGGYRPPMYPPDFDVFPDAVRRNIPALVDGFQHRGLRVGLCARPENGVTREEGKDPVLYTLFANKPDDMKTLIDRFRHCIDMGFDVFYLDSFGAEDPNDQEILKQLRTAVGPDVLFYTEFCTDLSLPYAGHYCEWQGGGILWTSPRQYEGLKFLCPDSTWLCIAKTGPTIPAEFAKLGLTPLVNDMQSNRLPTSQPSR